MPNPYNISVRRVKRPCRRDTYGPKSEQLSADQLQLLFETLQADEQLRQDAPVAPAIAAKHEKKPRKGGGRRAAPEHLPIERVEIDLPEAEKAGLVRIREEITEELDYRPSQFIRRHYVRFVYADPKKQTAPKLPELPAPVIPQASVGVGLLMHLLVSKYTECRYRHSVYHAASGTIPQNSVESSKIAGFTRVYSVERSA